MTAAAIAVAAVLMACGSNSTASWIAIAIAAAGLTAIDGAAALRKRA